MGKINQYDGLIPDSTNTFFDIESRFITQLCVFMYSMRAYYFYYDVNK